MTSDPAWNGGSYKQSADVAAGLKPQAKMWAVMGWSTEFYKQACPAALGFPTVREFIDNFMTGYFAPMDPTICSRWRGSGSAAMSAATPAAT